MSINAKPGDLFTLPPHVKASLIAAFLFLNTYSIFVQLLPSSSLRDSCLKYCNWYISLAVLQQVFAVFAPNIDTSNAHFIALITYNDESKSIWKYPKQSEMNALDRLLHFRYLPYSFKLQDHQLRGLLPGTAKHIAQLVYDKKNPSKRPVSVLLQIEWSEIKPHNSNRPIRSGLTDVFKYQVQAQDLL